jgi:hypothetical protein
MTRRDVGIEHAMTGDHGFRIQSLDFIEHLQE